MWFIQSFELPLVGSVSIIWTCYWMFQESLPTVFGVSIKVNSHLTAASKTFPNLRLPILSLVSDFTRLFIFSELILVYWLWLLIGGQCICAIEFEDGECTYWMAVSPA